MNTNSIGMMTTTSTTVDQILGQFGVFNNNNVRNANFVDDNVIKSLLNAMEKNDVCGVCDDMDNLFFGTNQPFATAPVSTASLTAKNDEDFFLNFFQNTADALENAVDRFADWVQGISPMCTSNQESQFDYVMDEFSKCSGYNMKELLDTVSFNPMILKMGLHCSGELIVDVDVDANYNIYDDDSSLMYESLCEAITPETKSWTPVSSSLSSSSVDNKCMNGMLGNNILGEFLRLFLATPSVACNCLSVFNDLPECRVNGNFFMDGKQLKKYVCVMNEQTCPFFADACDGRLSALNECLPSLEDFEDELFIGNRDTCREVICGCEAVDNGEMNYPARMMMELPLSDMCIQKARFSDEPTYVPERYERFQSICTSDVVNSVGFDENEDQIEDPVEVESTASEMISENHNVSDSITEGPSSIEENTLIEGISSAELVQYENENSISREGNMAAVTHESSEGPGAGIWILIAALLIIFGALSFMFWAYRRRSQQQRHREQTYAFMVANKRMLTNYTTDGQKTNNDDETFVEDIDDAHSQLATIKDDEVSSA